MRFLCTCTAWACVCVWDFACAVVEDSIDIERDCLEDDDGRDCSEIVVVTVVTVVVVMVVVVVVAGADADADAGSGKRFKARSLAYV